MLQDVPLFRGLSNEQINQIESVAERRHYKKGIVILNKDDDMDYLYVLISGKVNAFIDDEQGRMVIVNTMGAGETFGELAMLSGQTRSANIMAVEDCDVIIIQKDVIYKYIELASDFCKNIIRMLACKVNALTDDISSLALLDNYGRLVRLLEKNVTETPEGKSCGRLTQQDIADHIGATREMVSRLLKDLRMGGYIRIDRKEIFIEKPLPKGW